jgi:hypothetical protein
MIIRRKWCTLVVSASVSMVPGIGCAGVFGSLGNFDTVNDTGKPAYGFEIDIEDPSFDHTKITSVFGYNRVFSFISPDPGAVVRFGKPTITDVPGYGVQIIYGGTIGGSMFTPFNDPAAPFKPTPDALPEGFRGARELIQRESAPAGRVRLTAQFSAFAPTRPEPEPATRQPY